MRFPVEWASEGDEATFTVNGRNFTVHCTSMEELHKYDEMLAEASQVGKNVATRRIKYSIDKALEEIDAELRGY